MKLKDLFEAPRKPKEVPWPEEHSSFSSLRDIQSRFSSNRVPNSLQLFVPKHRDPAIEIDRKRDARVRHAGRELETVKEETVPILTAFHDSPPGNNKPNHAFWTSTAVKRNDGTYTSDWYEFVKDRFPKWQTDYGFLFEVKSTALVMESDYLDYYYEWAEKEGQMTRAVSDWAKEHGSPEFKMRSNFPWDTMSRHFDGVHHVSSYYGRNEFTDGWDVESTAWLKTDKLIYKGAVKLFHGDEDD